MPNIGLKVSAGLAAMVVLSAGAATGADLPGSKDPAFLKRYQGSQIIYSYSRVFDAYALIVPDPAKPAGTTMTEAREGAVTRLFYRVPPGHTALELLRNYEAAVKDAGFAIAMEFTPCAQQRRDIPDQVFKLVADPGLTTNPLVNRTGSFIFATTPGSFCSLTAKGSAGGQDIGLTVAIVEEADKDSDNRVLLLPKPVTLNAGETLVMVDTVATKAVQNKMVVVKAADIADALTSKGFIDLYGIYFDTDKTEVKPDSIPSLDEIASLLKIDRSLKLEISGHTDNMGAKDHNLKLSQGRADAVKTMLVSKYGIAAARLTAKGYGDTKPVAPNSNDANKAKNRRVELRKL